MLLPKMLLKFWANLYPSLVSSKQAKHQPINHLQKQQKAAIQRLLKQNPFKVQPCYLTHDSFPLATLSATICKQTTYSRKF
jgi:hypothetical protein